MKKTAFLLSSIIFILSLLNTQTVCALEFIFTPEISPPLEVELIDCYEIAQDTVRRYYYADETLETVDFNNVFLYENLNNYIQKRLEKSRMMLNIKSEYVSQESLIAEFFDATFTLQDYQFREDGLFVKLFIDAEVQYPNYDDRSYFGNAVDLLFVKKNNQIKIADIFFYGDTS